MRLIILLLLSCSLSAFAQESYECNLDIVKKTNANLFNLDEETLNEFLLTFDASCSSNVEYQEQSNITLIKVLTANPSLLVNILEKSTSEINRELIYREMGNPIQPLNYPKTIDRVKAIKENSKTKERVLSILEELKK